MSFDLLAQKIRLGKNSRANQVQYDFLASKSDTDGRLEAQFLGYGTDTFGPEIAVGHARGTVDAPANNVLGDGLGDFEWYAFSNVWHQCSEIMSFVAEVVVPGVSPSTDMVFRVTTGGTMVDRMKIFPTGRVGIGSASRASSADAVTHGAGALWVAENSSRPQICFQHSASNVNAAQIIGRKSRGASLSAPTNVAAGDAICELRAQSLSNTWFDGGYIEFAVDAAVVAGQAPATNFGIFVNANNAATVQALKIGSDRKYIMGTSMTLFTDAAFNYNLAGGVDQIVATYGQSGGSPNSMIFGYSTYSSGYTNGHPARMYVGDSSFSCYIRFDLKLQNAASNSVAPAFLMFPGVAAHKAAFFSNAGSFGGGEGVIFIANRTTAPGSNPSGGGILYAEGGALRWRGSSGTVTTIAPA